MYIINLRCVRLTWKSQLLLERTEHETKGLGPHQIEEEAESAETPNPPLVFAHAIAVHLAVDEDALLLVERQALHFWIIAVAGGLVGRVDLSILW